jgi:hypothetical protein
MPKYAFHLDNYQIIDYYDDIPVPADKVFSPVGLLDR